MVCVSHSYGVVDLELIWTALIFNKAFYKVIMLLPIAPIITGSSAKKKRKRKIENSPQKEIWSSKPYQRLLSGSEVIIWKVHINEETAAH